MLSTTLLDDWGPETLTPDQARDLLEIVEDRRLYHPKTAIC
jgi:DNA replication protein DnaC